MPVREWEHLSTVDFATIDAESAVAVLPVGAVEQHGPHLPLGTDAIICAGVVDAALARLDSDVTVLRLPAQRIGLSPEHARFAGTLTVAAETLIAFWTAIGRSVRAAGLRRLVLVNSHGGQPQIVDLVAQRLRADHAMLAVRANLSRLGLPDGAVAEEERRHGLHGGEIETALMLHLAPELVRGPVRRDFASAIRREPEAYGALGGGGSPIFAWMSGDLNPDGVTGNAARATAATGQRLLDHLATRLARIFRDTARFDLSRLG